MSTIRLTRQFTFEMAHALWNYDGPCRNIHGHSYRLYVTVTGSPDANPNSVKLGMVIDFGELKRIVNESITDVFDHAVVVNRLAPADFRNQVDQMFEKYIMVDYQPTCENLVCDFATRLKYALPDHVKLHHLRLDETATSCAEWFADDNP